MSWKKGQSGNPKGRLSEKPFLDALRLAMLASDGDEKSKLRRIADRLLSAALAGEAWAIQQVADRLDGKPAQESTVTVEHKSDATDWTRDELVAFLHDATKSSNGAAKANGGGGKPDSVH